MNTSDWPASQQRRWEWAARSSGLLMWLAFPGVDLSPALDFLHLPGPNLWWLTPWVGLLPFCLVVPHLSAKRAFFVSWQTGMIFSAPSLVWLVGHVPVAGSFGILSFAFLVPYLAIYWAVNGALLRLVLSRIPLLAVLIVPAIWATSEWLQNHLLSGFGWLFLAHTQGANLPLMQLASWGGVYAVTFALVFVNMMIWLALTRNSAYLRVAAIAATLATVWLVHAWGAQKLKEPQPTTSALKVGIVQGSFATEVKWDRRYREFIWQEHEERTRDAKANGAELIVWSESALGPYAFSRDEANVLALAEEVDAPIVLGTTYVYEPEGQQDDWWYTNAVVAAFPNGKVSGPYNKIHLTPFGEYLPFRNQFAFILRFIAIISDFSPGVDYVTLDILGVRVQPLICFESVFPHDVREAVRASRPELILHHTNVGWFGRSSMPEQDLVVTRYRAIETGTPIVRAANIGISGVIDAHGRVTAVAADSYGNRVHEPVTLVAEVVPGSTPTAYKRFGDAFSYACALLIAAALYLCYIRAPRPS